MSIGMRTHPIRARTECGTDYGERVIRSFKRNSWSECVPLLEQEGGCAIKKMLRSHRKGADGVVSRDEHFSRN